MRLFYTFLFLLCLLKGSLAQTDQSFWFVAPEVTNNHGDRPIFLKVSSFDQAANVTIDQPANPNFNAYNFSVPKDEVRKINLTSQINKIENKPGGQVLDKGLYIQASSPITAYYEIGYKKNTDLFTLKGDNALGTQFIIPGQFSQDNYSGYSKAKNSFDIVAAHDNTKVTITLTHDSKHHIAGQPFTINLDKGETYSVIAQSQKAGKHLHGSQVQSNKPIAITIKDDSIKKWASYDVFGDQIIPVSVLGKEYIAVKGFSRVEKVFVIGTEPNTKIHVKGNNSIAATIGKGDTFSRKIRQNALYLKASKPVNFAHLSGFDTELGGSILPSINCSGSREVAFNRSSPKKLGVIILTKSGGTNNFKVNGKQNIIQAGDFSKVPGTNGQWMAARVQLNQNQSSVNNTTLVENSKQDFHLGIINEGGQTAGCRYGYFSSFIDLNLSSQLYSICQDENVKINAGKGFQSYKWSTGDTSQEAVLKDTGKQWVKVTKKGCQITDSFRIIGERWARVNLPGDTTLCEEPSFRLNPETKNINDYLWQDNTTDSFLKVRDTGLFWVKGSNKGCSATDSISISYKKLDLGPDTSLCKRDSLVLDVDGDFNTYQWQDGSKDTMLTVRNSGIYWVKGSSKGCKDSDTIRVEFTKKQLSIQLPSDTALCTPDSFPLLLDPKNKNVEKFLWQDQSTDSFYYAKKPGLYWVKGVNGECSVQDSTRIRQVRGGKNKDTVLCEGDPLVLTVDTGVKGYDNHEWKGGSNSLSLEVRDSGTYWVDINTNDCRIRDSFHVNKKEKPGIRLRSDTTICPNDTINLEIKPGNYRNVLWQDSSSKPYYTVNQPGLYWVKVTGEKDCSNRDSTKVTLKDTRDYQMNFPDTMICEGDTLTLKPEPAFKRVKWQDSVRQGQYLAKDSGFYWFKTQNECGKSGDTIQVSTRECYEECRLFVPNAFSPNGDGLNDVFKPVSGCQLKDYRFAVYNRWGELVFETNHFDKGWDGTHDGEKLSSGVFIWTVKGVAENYELEKKFIVKSGDVTLIR